MSRLSEESARTMHRRTLEAAARHPANTGRVVEVINAELARRRFEGDEPQTREEARKAMAERERQGWS
jgi:hypothetical protein